MNTSNKDRSQPDNMEILKQQSEGCGAGCACHTGAAPGGMRWIICGIVLIAAGILVVRAMNKPDEAATAASEPAFAAPVAVASATSPTAPPVATSPADPAQTPTAAANDSASAEAPAAAAKPTAASAATVIGSFAELNTAAASTDAVFVYLPGKAASDHPPISTIEAAVRTMQSRGVNCGIFALKADSQDYNAVAAQVTVPGVLAMVKGHGSSAVSGEITETKLIQAYVAASSAGGCGCGPSGCQ